MNKAVKIRLFTPRAYLSIFYTRIYIMNSFALTVHDAVKTYSGGASPVLNGVNLTLEPGGSFVILGATGSGKSTLLRSVAGLET